MSNHLLDELAKLRNGHTIEQRLRWLEDRVYWMRELNRADLIDRFGISPQQASADIALYQKFAPSNLTYDSRKKQYVAEVEFKKLFEKDCDAWLKNNSDEPASLRSIRMTTVAPLRRWIPDEIVQALSRAYRLKTPLAIQYQSMKSIGPQRRVICPHNIVQTDIRWHVRAWDASSGRFVDLVPSRIQDIQVAKDVEWVPAESDVAWNNWIEIVLVPSSGLSESQRQIVERDYQMTDGQRILVTRECLAYYQLAAMHLVDAVRHHEGNPIERNFGVAVKNWRDMVKFV